MPQPDAPEVFRLSPENAAQVSSSTDCCVTSGVYLVCDVFAIIISSGYCSPLRAPAIECAADSAVSAAACARTHVAWDCAACQRPLKQMFRATLEHSIEALSEWRPRLS